MGDYPAIGAEIKLKEVRNMGKETASEKFKRLHPNYFQDYLVKHREERNLASKLYYRRLAEKRKKSHSSC